MIHADVAIVGGGMSGASLAAELVAHRSVVLIEGGVETVPHLGTGHAPA